MRDIKAYEVWFITGSQHLYGEQILQNVERHAKEVALALDENPNIPVQVIGKGLATTETEIYNLCQQANLQQNCIGVIVWMHTFSLPKCG